MKITDFALVIMIVMLPLLLYSEWRSDDTATLSQLNKQYDSALTTVTQDATQVLRTNVAPELEAGYSSMKINPTNLDVALKTFLHTLSLNFQIEGSNDEDILSHYVPVFAVLVNDGLSLNVFQKSIDKDENSIVKRTWLPKIPFSYSDKQGNIINFSVDQNIEVYVSSLNEWYEGTREEVLSEIANDVDVEEPEEEEKEQTLLDRLPDELRDELEEALSEELFNKLMDELEKLTIIDNLTDEILDEIAEESSYQLVDKLLTVLSPIDDEEDEEEDDNGSGGDSESNLQNRLSEETKAALAEVLSKESYENFMQALKESRTEFDIPAEILNELMETLPDDLFDKVIVELATESKDEPSCKKEEITGQCVDDGDSSDGEDTGAGDGTGGGADTEVTPPDETKPDTPNADNKLTILLLGDSKEFNRIRKHTIVSTMQEEFAYYINTHNTYAKNLGINYKFTFPLISQEDWFNTVDDVGVFSFVQGYPMKRVDNVYNQHAFAGARIFRSEVIMGATVNNKKVFYNNSCKFEYKATEIFNSKKEAAKAGYSELSCLNTNDKE
ncbi:hypothetical protein [Viridibacillus arvi]|uniref:hypothetical protein n=1 Tax=Viridibacillus arvi TaxID=263475 RepID=UPI003D282B65